MALSTKRSVSKRFFQLSFEGFRPAGRNKLEQFFHTWLSFFRSLVGYALKKVAFLVSSFVKFLFFIVSIPKKVKEYTIKKLIWSRGKLGRSVAAWIVMAVAFIVFLFGEVFSSSTFIIDQPVSADFLATTSDIIAKKEMALTTLPEMRQRNEPFLYKVAPGDTLYSIGEQFKISSDAIKYVNGLTDSSILRVGQDLTIPPVSGLIHKVESGDTLNSIANEYGVAPQAIADFNYLLDTSHLALGTELVIPGGKVPKVVVPVYDVVGVPSTGADSGIEPNKSLCVWPTTVRIITQYFSWYHNGIDVATPTGSQMPPLLACTDGTVIRAGWDPFGLGLHVRIDHGSGYETVYGHMSRIDVSYGQKVSKGEIIGLMGNTGRSTGPHVHFMVKYNGVAQNPLNFTN